MNASTSQKKYKKRKLFIMIPAYNEEKSITEVIKRSKKIEIKNVEIITLVINDGSKDNTERLARSPYNKPTTIAALLNNV